MNAIIKILSNCCAAILLFGPAAYHPPTALAAAPTSITSDDIADIIDKYRQEIPQHMQLENIPGLAIAVVDDHDILWSEGFGYTDWDRRTPVSPYTIFSIQSMSKSFTATAAMFAAQEGLVDLDAPITTYLPNFHVHSIFEEHPEQKMTLRILLSHTAGFPHDTSYGNNNDHPADYSFEKHIASISDTWLMFPVGTRYSYSNEGIDLAGYILQVRSGMPFIQYVQKKVLEPLGMKDSTLDINRIRATSTRAIGHVGPPLRPPVDLLIIPSGGVWTNAEDMARYIQFHINKGVLGGVRLLKEELAETMYTPPNAPAQDAYQGSGYALGVTVGTRNGAVYIEHGGGGFGFNSDMAWYPELKLGVVVLSNAYQSYYFSLSLDVLDNIIASNIPLYRQRYLNATNTTPAYPQDEKVDILTNDALRKLIANHALPKDAAALQRRNAYTGTYIMTIWGFPETGETFEISSSNGEVAWFYQGDLNQYSKHATLTEVEPGLFFSENGNLFDLRGPVPVIDNIRLIKANTQALPLQVVFYALCGLVFLSALFFWPARALIRSFRRKSAPAEVPAAAAQPSRWSFWVGMLAALASLFSVFCMAVIAFVPNLVYIPWPLPFLELTWWQFALVGLPFVNLGMAVMVTLLAMVSRRRYSWPRPIRWYYIAVGLALLAFNAMILL